MNHYAWKIKAKAPRIKKSGWLLSLLAQNRGLRSKAELKEFLNPTLDQILKVKLTEVEKARDRTVSAIKNKEKIVV